MADTGWTFVGTGASDGSSGTEPWRTTGNITADDGSFSDVNNLTWGNGELTELLKGTNLGFAVPAGATIDGIEVRLEIKSSFVSGDDKIVRVSLVRAGSPEVYDIVAVPVNVPNSWTVITYGDASELWNATWNDSDVNHVGFGFVLQCQKVGGSNVAPQVDYFQVRVHYTETNGSCGVCMMQVID